MIPNLTRWSFNNDYKLIQRKHGFMAKIYTWVDVVLLSFIGFCHSSQSPLAQLFFCCMLAMNWREDCIFVLSMIWSILIWFPPRAEESTSLMTLVLFVVSSVLTRASVFSETVFFPVCQGERKIKKVSLVPGQLLCLEHAVQQEYFSQHHASLLHAFVSK